MIFIDTDLAISFLSNKNNKITNKAKSVLINLFKETDTIYLTVFNYAELLRGAYISSRVAENIRIIQEFCRRFTIIPFSEVAIEKYATIYAELKQKGQSIGDLDELIASIVLANDATIYSHNTDHFNRINLLKVTDWIEL